MFADKSEIKVKIETENPLENETITQEQFESSAKKALENLDEYKALKELLDDGVLENSSILGKYIQDLEVWKQVEVQRIVTNLETAKINYWQMQLQVESISSDTLKR